MTGPDGIDVVVHDLLAARGATVATAESLTGGLVGAWLTEMPGSSRTYRGGVVAYATDLKTVLLGVPAETAARGVVSAEVVAAMATGARDRLAATYGVGLTGVAGPEWQDGVAPGTVFVAVAGPDGVETRRLRVAGDRVAIRTAAASGALGLLREMLEPRT